MTIELDHVFILVSSGAPEAEQIASIGLVEGASNDHSGQGTANRRFIVANTTLELLYLRDAQEAAGGPAAGLHFPERDASAMASPFGLITRRVEGSTAEPFDGWAYCPDYFSANTCFHVGDNAALLNEPLCICMPANLPRRAPQSRCDNPGWHLTELRICTPAEPPSATLSRVAECQVISLETGCPHAMTLTFNNAENGESRCFAPEMPLTMCW